MAKKKKRVKSVCLPCHHYFTSEIDSELAVSNYADHLSVRCPRCMAHVTLITPRGTEEIRVSGERWEEVRDVTENVLERMHERVDRLPRSPWATGTFYLLSVLLVITLLLIVGRHISLWVFPVVVIGGLTLVGVIGAFQLRHDARLSEKNFLELMKLVFQQLPVIAKVTGKGSAPESSGEDKR